MTFSSESEDSEVRSRFVVPLDAVSSARPKDNKRHACTFEGCNAKFSRPWRLSAHLSVHTGNRAFTCPENGCNKQYTSSSHLRRHQLTSHTPEAHRTVLTFTCESPGCSKEFKTRQNLKKHLKRAHTDLPFICQECGEGFKKNHLLKAHSFNHTGINPFSCEDCDESFPNLQTYKRHRRKHYTKIHLCPEPNCLEAFSTWTLLRKHIANHPEVYVCHYCQKTYSKKSYLTSHIRRHLKKLYKEDFPEVKKKVFVCNQCGRPFFYKAVLARHIRAIHEMNGARRKKVGQRNRRKDAGQPKKSIAGILAQVELPPVIEQTLLQKETFQSEFEIVIEDDVDQDGPNEEIHLFSL